jgi:hypothetical protein
LQISVPKAGTYLFGNMTNSDYQIIALRKQPQARPIDQLLDVDELLPLFKELDMDANYKGHIPFHPELENIVARFETVLLIIRDPRDIIVSMANYVQKIPTSALNFITPQGQLSKLRFPQRVDFLIETMCPFFEAFEPWRDKSYVHVFKYETFQKYPGVVIDRLNDLGFGATQEIFERSKEKAYTFRKGTINNWKLEFSPVQKRDAWVQFGDIIEKWSGNV